MSAMAQWGALVSWCIAGGLLAVEVFLPTSLPEALLTDLRIPVVLAIVGGTLTVVSAIHRRAERVDTAYELGRMQGFREGAHHARQQKGRVESV
ncbi:hypothetical protein [Nocardiopsis dassonvillei]|uniref:hypothetical protein n=1 Tax=Nocardiopsis dassonvillei TaxID=2014 RepID=UPI0036347281